MNQTGADRGARRAALDAEFNREVARLAGAARRPNPVESVMRIRALVEISGWLDTDALIALAEELSAAHEDERDPL